MKLPVNKIMCGDCIDVMKQMPEEFVDLVVTSPPYNIGIEYDSWKDSLPWDEYLMWCDNWINLIYKILKNDGRFVLNVLTNINIKGGKRQHPLIDFGNLILKNKLNIHGIAFWTDITRTKYTAWGSWKSASAPYVYNPYEALFICYKNEWKKSSKGQDSISKKDFLYGVQGAYNFGTSNNKHVPATFPIKLPRLFIELLSFEDDLVLDPFSGSGTTCAAAKELNRKYIGIDISKKYCNYAREQLRTLFDEVTG